MKQFSFSTQHCKKFRKLNKCYCDCCGVWNHPHKNGLIQAHKKTKLKQAKDLVIGYLLYNVFPYLYIYSKNRYPLS